MQNYKICIPISERKIEDIIKKVDFLSEKGVNFFEIRIDYLKNPSVKLINSLFKNLDVSTIVTNRISSEGGLFKGSEKERINLLIEASKYSDYTDIELNTSEKYRADVINSANKSIISFHDFEKTPSIDFLLNVVKQELELGDIAKFAVMPNSMNDTVTVMEVLREYPNTVAISMGDFGKYTRIMAPIFGAPFTFASYDDGTAPGQLSFEVTKYIKEHLE